MRTVLPTESGRFWICPECRRHVPTRIETCRCGFNRVQNPGRAVQMSQPAATAAEASRARGSGLLIWFAVLPLSGALIYVGTRDWNKKPEAELAGTRRLKVPAQAPQIVYVPVPVTPTPGQSGQMPSGSLLRQAGTVEQVLPTTSPIPTTPAAAAASVPQLVHAVPELSETDRRRLEGTGDFEQQMVWLSQRADAADVAWQRYLEGCRLEVTSSYAAAAVGGRGWFAAAWAGATTTRQTEACAEAGTFYALSDQVKSGMCLAEDRARMASVYPGTRRDLRRRYRLDWDGWDRVCR